MNSYIKFFCLTLTVGLGMSCSTHRPETTHSSLHSKFHKSLGIREPARAIDPPDAGKITGVPTVRHSEMFIVFDDSGSMGTYITDAQKAVTHLLVNTAATARAGEIPFVHFFPLNSEVKPEIRYPYQGLIGYLEQGYPTADGGTPFAGRLKGMQEYISDRTEFLKKDDKSLSKIIIYVFTDGEPDGSDGETGNDWINAVRGLHLLANDFRNVDVQLTVLGAAMPLDLYNQFENLQTNYSAENFSLSVNRTEDIGDIERDAQALAERLLVDRLQSRISTAKYLVEEIQSTLPSLKSQLSELKNNNLLNLPDPAAIEELLNRAVEEFKKDQNQQTAQSVVSEFRKISDISSETIKIRDLLTELKAKALNLHQRFNASEDGLKDIGKTINKMTEEQRGRFSDLISQYEEVRNLFGGARNSLNQSGEGNQPLHTEIANILQSLTTKTETVKRGYNTLLENSLSLVSFLESLPEDVRLKIEADLAAAKDVAIDYQNKTIIYTGVHYFKGGKNGPGYQTDWTVVNRGTIVNLGGPSGGGAIAKKFINEGVVLHGGSTQARPVKAVGEQLEQNEGYTHIVNNGKIIRLTQRVPATCPKDYKPCGNLCCSEKHSEDLTPSRFHWQRYDENGKANFVIYNEKDSSIYHITWDFITNFKRGTTWIGKIYNFFARLFYDSKIGDKLHELKDIDNLQGEEAKTFLQSLYPEEVKALRRTKEEWFALVPKDIIPVFEDIFCIEMNGDLGYGTIALTDESLKRELEFKRKVQCGR